MAAATFPSYFANARVAEQRDECWAPYSVTPPAAADGLAALFEGTARPRRLG
jgi:hypothetical protein